MKFYITFTRSKLIAILCAMMASLFLFSRFYSAYTPQENGDTHAKRLSYAQSIGCVIDEDSQTEKSIVLPFEFSDVYRVYNDLQKEGGYDLSPYKGCRVTIYTYKVKSYKDFTEADNAVLNLMVYNGRIIGGDVSSLRLNGEMFPICR